MAIDKNEAIIKYLIDCPSIYDNPLFFNFAEGKDDNNQIVINSNDKAIQKPFIDGSVEKCYTFTIVTYKSVSFNAVVKQTGYPDENLVDMSDAQGIIDWIVEQDDLKNYPDFGTDCIIESITPQTENPTLIELDKKVQPPLASYSVAVDVKYLDKSKIIWN